MGLRNMRLRIYFRNPGRRVWSSWQDPAEGQEKDWSEERGLEEIRWLLGRGYEVKVTA